MARPIFIFLTTLFLNNGTGNERLLAFETTTQSAFAMPAGSAAERGAWVARRIDERDTGRDGRLAMRMRLFDRRNRVRERALVITSLRGGAGRLVPTDRTLIRFTAPADIRGTGFLVWEQLTGDDERFFYLPSLGRVRRIAGTEAQESFVGSDFTYEDIGGRELDAYDYRLLDETSMWTAADGTAYPAYRLESRRKDAGATFPRVESLIRKDNFLVVEARIFNRRDEAQKTYATTRVERVDGYWTVLAMSMTDAQAGTRTELVIEKAEYDVGLNADDFTRRELERVASAPESGRTR
jgi:Outer membrane lipoprotein-sorting protein